ncbi:ATP-binding cassette domain-containing protein [Cognatishimia sp. SS12]|uniref:ABC transporter ATP-binding protein n=1 Tax=Cognatishimia sp. SS12 TaxID=2979465 RepID=UPI00232AE1F7|nr:oligopeptide/dipeptide ABC transporter ATP-binding protein [Cognatishimia sp. SS12]MDC0738263.1 ATP-binding cassette domain-containing protein [Cognatishimia sp. SS12]
MTSEMISVQDLAVRFTANQTKKWPWSKPGVVKAVNGVSFAVNRGQTLGIVGESGCGKSTLVRAIAGLVKPSHGTVRVGGKVVDYSRRKEVIALRRQVQMIFQDPVASLNPRMTIRDIIAEPLVMFFPEMNGEARETRVHALLDRVGIPRRNANRYPHEFSGGQCQRIGIARALAAEPKVLLCDEPVSALDVSIQAQVVNLLQELQADMGLTLIFVAHDLGVVRHISDEILVMYLGGMMEQAPADALVARPTHPYTRALLSAVPVPDPSQRITPQVLDGDLPSPLNLPQGCLFQSRCPARLPECATTRPDLKRDGRHYRACLLEAS